MSLCMVVNGATVEIPREIEAQGGAAVTAWLAARAKVPTTKPPADAEEEE